MSPLPALVFVPGAWHTPACFKKVIEILTSHGYESTPLHLPSVSKTAVVKDMEPDKAMIRSAVTKLADEGKDVIVISHSYGGIPTNSALEGLSKTERARDGKKGGVVKSAMIAAFLLDVGGTVNSGRGFADWITVQNDVLIANQTDFKFYNDMPASEAEYWRSQLLPMAAATFETKPTYAVWKVIPVAYLLCEKDNAIPLAFQQMMCDNARKAGGSVETESIDAGHSPFLSRPSEVVSWLRRLAGDSI